MIRLAIVEDEDWYANQLMEYIRQFSEKRNQLIRVTRFSDGDEIAEEYTGEFDIILMDIQMRFMNGMDAATEIRKKDSQVIIIFITNMADYAVRGYEVDALDYIVKPVEFFSFSQKMARAISRIPEKKGYYITVHTGSGVRKISLDSLFYIESQDHWLVYHISGEEIRSRGVMKEADETLTEYGFFRSNKGYLVNMRHVDGVQDGCCLIHGELLPISRQKKKAFMEEMSKYMSEIL